MIYPVPVRPSSRARAALLLLYGAVLAWQLDRWCFTPHGIVSTWADRHDGRTVSAGSPGGVSQTFEMGADGLDGVWLRPLVTGGAARGELVIDVLQGQGDSRQRLLRVAIPATDVRNDVALHVPFRPIRASRGLSYQMDVRHVHMAGGPAIDLAVTRDDAVGSGRLFADGREQWGDLVFETSSRRATLPYWLHEVLRPWPAWLHAWPAVTLGLLMFNGVLAWACATAVGAIGAIEDVPARTAAALPGAHASRRSLATIVVLLGTIMGVGFAGRRTPREHSLDLIAALPDARVETAWGAMHHAISPESVLFTSGVHRSIVAMPPSTIAWTVDVPRSAVLRMGAAMRPDMWERRSDGIQMRVHVDHNGGRTTVADLTLFPLGVPEHRRLVPLELPLQPWAGQRVVVVLETTPERWGNAVNDVPVWTEPRIEWSRALPSDGARVVRP